MIDETFLIASTRKLMSGVVRLCVRGFKTRVHIFYFDSNTTAVPLQCAALVLFGKRMLTGCRLVDC